MSIGGICLFCMRGASVWIATIFFILSLLAVGVMTRLHYKPYDLVEYMPAIHDLLSFDKLGGVRLDNIVLSFDGNLKMIGNGVLVVAPDEAMIATASQVKFSLALKSLLWGRVGFKKAEIDGLALRILKESNGKTTIGDFTLPIQPKNSKDLPSLIGVLSQLDNNPQFKYLQMFDLKNMMMELTLDTEQQGVWTVTQTDMFFSRHNKVGERLTLTGVLSKDSVSTPFYSSFEHRYGEETGHFRARVESVDSAFFSPLLPVKIKSILQAPIQHVDVRAIITGDNTLKNSKITTRLGSGIIKLPELYDDDLDFKSANIVMSLQVDDNVNTLFFEDILFEDNNGVLIKGGGLVRDEKEKGVYTDLRINIPESSLKDISSYLPRKRMPDALNWIEKNININDTRINNISVRLVGYLQEAPFTYANYKDGDNILEVNFDFSNLNTTFLPTIPPIINVAGNGALQGDSLRIFSSQGGKILNQELSSIRVVLDDIMRPEGQALIHAEARLSGDMQEALDIIFKHTKTEPFVSGLKGSQKSLINLSSPINGKPEDVTFAVTSETTDIKLDLPYINKPFVADTLYVEASDKEIVITSEGKVSLLPDTWWDTKIMWREDMVLPGSRTSIKGQVTTIDNPNPDLMKELNLDIKGAIHHHFSINTSESNDWLDISVNSNLKNASIDSGSFEWAKDAATNGNLEVKGKLHKEGKEFDLQKMVLKAPKAEINGAMYLRLNSENIIDDISLNFDPFIIGETKAKIIYEDGVYSLTGDNFNFSKIGKGKLHTDLPLKNGKYEIDLKKLSFKGGVFESVSGHFIRTDDKWQEANFNALVGDKKPITMSLSKVTPEKGKPPYKKFEIHSGDAGSALKALGVYDNLREGRLEAVLNISKEYSAFGMDGKGYILVENSFMKNAPVMARILSMVSLQQIISVGKGIAFDKIKIPLKMDDRVLIIKKGRLRGPNIGMRLAGFLDFKNNNMNLSGSLIPIRGVNTVVAAIPILGMIITGSQGALIAADFRVKGAIDEPDVSANPLSLVTPGILKDIWTGIFGDDSKYEEN